MIYISCYSILLILRIKFKDIQILNYGLVKETMGVIIYFPYIKFFGKKLYLSI
jgi:hypothetical protein